MLTAATMRGTFRRSALASSASFGILAACLIACGTSDGGGTSDPKACVAHTNPTIAELKTPISLFENDVMPIFSQSCAFSSCHGSKGAGNHGIYLGAKSAADFELVKQSLASKSKVLPSMPYVMPGDPDKSFLLHKLDGDLCAFEESCTNGSCGTPMPENNPALPEASRDAIRRWIAQGAK